MIRILVVYVSHLDADFDYELWLRKVDFQMELANCTITCTVFPDANPNAFIAYIVEGIRERESVKSLQIIR